MLTNVKIPIFRKGDLDASIGVFFDGFSKVIVTIAILMGTFGLDSQTVFGVMMPGVLVSALVLHGGLWLYYRRIAAQRQDPNLTAIPGGLQAGRMFIWLFSIMLPIYTSTGDAVLAFRAGVLAHFISGAIFVVGAFVGLLVGCVFVFIIDNKWLSVSITNLVALALTLVGMIHSPGLLFTAAYAPDSGFIAAYIVLSIVFLVLHLIHFNQSAHKQAD